jgi:hypothetical protein
MKRLTLAILVVLLLVLPSLPAQAQEPAADELAASMAQYSGLLVIDTASGPAVSTTSTTWADVPGMNGGFSLAGTSDVAITFCAESFVSAGKRMAVRAVVDGLPASPSDVIFANVATWYSRCFTFVKNSLGSGYHTVTIQWLVDSGGTAYLGDRTTHITWAQVGADELALLAWAAPSGPDKIITGGAGWTDVPDMGGSIYLAAVSDLAITFSAEADASNGRRIFLRALVDGVVASPSDEILVVGGYLGVRSFTFVMKDVLPGNRAVSIQAMVEGGGDGNIGDRTLKVVGARVYQPIHVGHLFVAAPSGPDVTTTSAAYVDVPNLNGTIYVPTLGDLAVTFTAEINASGTGRIFARVLLDGAVVSPSDVVHTTGGWNGAHAFSFVKRNVSAGYHTVKIQWGVDAGNTAYAGDRTMTAYTFGKLALHPPRVVDMIPLCGRKDVGPQVYITTTYYDPDGFNDIKLVYLILNTGVSYVNGVGVAYNLQLNKMVMRNDANTAWLVGGAPGTSGNLDTSLATLEVPQCVVSKNGNNLSIQWVFRFKAPLSGRVLNAHTVVADYGNLHSGWQTVGTLGVGTNGSPPCVGNSNIAMSAKVGDTTTYWLEADDPDGWSDLKISYLIIGPEKSTTGPVVYIAYNQNANMIFLRNDAGNAWLGGYAPGSAHTIDNSRVTVDVAQCQVDTSQDYLRVKVAMRFKAPFVGYKQVYASALDDKGYYAAWHRQGSWEIVP